MAINPALTTAPARNASPKTTTSDKPSSAGEADFSHTLANSRKTRDSAPGTSGDRKSETAGKPGERAVSRLHADRGTNPPADASTRAAPSATGSTDRDVDASAHIRRRYISGPSEHNAASRQFDEGRAAATASRSTVPDPGELAATTPAHPDTAAQGRINAADKALRDDDRKPHVERSREDSPEPHQPPGPIAALIQAPLMPTARAASTDTAPTDAVRSSGDHAKQESLRARWQQLIQLDGRRPTTGQALDAGHASNQRDTLAAMLDAVSAGNGRNPAATSDDAGPQTRLGILQAHHAHSDSAGNGPLFSASTPAQPAVTGPGASLASTTTIIGAPIASDDWNQALGQQTLRLAGQGGQQQAQIQLHPRELGPLSISVTVNDHQQAQIHLASAHAHVRDAVEAALPQLRQSLAAGGLSLGQASVGDQNSQPAFAGGDDSRHAHRGTHDGDVTVVSDATRDAAEPVPHAAMPSTRGGIDIFA
ncbi:flagellar hook-length control protein FliK [Salinisphaera sp. Q1T1-3]|uniref:flagellar hook-length control protein FliK n=1 Tax=Salinisphaera sp. Q1T1-3 TaxID=2321229 RepID=UPI001313EEBE|nr:flagellar hook-length control protein FliK [Salinisphaera sp. Q1T1-3]